MSKPIVGIVMGSVSDWSKMREASDVLESFGVSHESKILSAHRTPELVVEYAKKSEEREIEIIIAGAGGAAHLAGMIASNTITPVLGVPIDSKYLNGIDSLLSTIQMPAGIPVGTLAIGDVGAKNAGLLAISILANTRPTLKKELKDYRKIIASRALKGQTIIDRSSWKDD